jgi:hypothetical protein
VLLTPLINIHSRISPRIFEKFEMVLMGYSGALGTLIYEKNLKAKISCQTPFQMLFYNGTKSISFLGLNLSCGEPHLCGQLPKQHTSKPVYVVVDNSYTVNLICIHNCVQKYTSVYCQLLPDLFACMFRVLP